MEFQAMAPQLGSPDFECGASSWRVSGLLAAIPDMAMKRSPPAKISDIRRSSALRLQQPSRERTHAAVYGHLLSLPADPLTGEMSDPPQILQHHLQSFLQRRDPPKTFCPSEVARALTADDLRALGFHEWRDAMSAVRELAWDWRASGECEILQKGVVLSDEVGMEDVRGPIRLRRT
nr:hypothetical protein CFP56_52866 [Quercus suber]